MFGIRTAGQHTSWPEKPPEGLLPVTSQVGTRVNA